MCTCNRTRTIEDLFDYWVPPQILPLSFLRSMALSCQVLHGRKSLYGNVRQADTRSLWHKCSLHSYRLSVYWMSSRTFRQPQSRSMLSGLICSSLCASS